MKYGSFSEKNICVLREIMDCDVVIVGNTSVEIF